jgi:hypothetical protein
MFRFLKQKLDRCTLMRCIDYVEVEYAKFKNSQLVPQPRPRDLCSIKQLTRVIEDIWYSDGEYAQAIGIIPNAVRKFLSQYRC